MNFGEALEVLKGSGKVCRKGWNGKGMWIELHQSDELDSTFIVIHGSRGEVIPWLASQSDVLAEDWQHFKSK
jgi:hypothetical protein